MNDNQKFLNSINPEVRSDILRSIADHYQTTPDCVEAELYSPVAHNLLEYMVDPYRKPTATLWKLKGFSI